MNRTEYCAPHAPVRLAAGVCCALLAWGCATTAPAPRPEQPKPPAPIRSGATVMLLPAQPTAGPVPAGLDAELAFWLARRAPRIDWVGPNELARVLARTPAFDIDLRQLAVDAFLQAEVRRIGGPLYGELRRLAAVTDARYALIPVAASYVSADSTAGRVEIAAALIDVWSGRVVWYGVVGGRRGAPAAPGVAASAAGALARALFPQEESNP